MNSKTFIFILIFALLHGLLSGYYEKQHTIPWALLCYDVLFCAYFLVAAIIYWKRAHMFLTGLTAVFFICTLLVVISTFLRTDNRWPLWVTISAVSCFVLAFVSGYLSNKRYPGKLLVIKENARQASFEDFLLFKYIPRFEA